LGKKESCHLRQPAKGGTTASAPHREISSIYTVIGGKTLGPFVLKWKRYLRPSSRDELNGAGEPVGGISFSPKGAKSNDEDRSPFGK